MTETKKETHPQPVNWPPEFLSKYVEHKLKSDPKLDLSYKSGLTRLLDPNDASLKLAFEKLCKKHEPATVVKYLEQVCDRFLDIEIYRPISEAEYTKWLGQISRKSLALEKTISEIPSPDLIVPDGLINVHSLLLFLLGRYGNEMTHDEYMKRGQQLQRFLERIPLSTLLRELAVLAEQEKAKPRHHYWESDLEIKVSRKQGSDGSIVREQILIKSVKNTTLDLLETPHHELVAILVNTLMGSEHHTADSISKTPK